MAEEEGNLVDYYYDYDGEDEEEGCNASLLLNMSKACISGVCDGGDEYGNMCGKVTISLIIVTVE